MSATASTPQAQPTLDISGTQRTPFGRLVAVECRKLTDTRANFWLLAVTALLLLITTGLVFLIVGLNDLTTSSNVLAQVFTFPVSILVPVFAVLTVTGEWSQRVALASFTLEPHRLRVVLAKLVAVSALAVLTIVLAIALGALSNVLCGVMTGNDPTWDLSVAELLWLVVQQAMYFLMGFGFGLLLLNTPGAVSVYYVVALFLPVAVYSALFAIFDWARDVLPWVDMGIAMSPLVSGTDFNGLPVDPDLTNYAQAVFTVLLWVALPIVLGVARVQRAEVK